MIHEKYLHLVHDNSDTVFIAELSHCVMHDTDNFELAASMINTSKQRGVLKNVSFYPDPIPQSNNEG